MNTNAYTQIEGEDPQLPETNEAGRPENPLETADPNENKLTRIINEDPTTGTQITLNIYNHQLQTLSKMHTKTGDSRDEERKELRHDTADLIWTAHKDHATPSSDPPSNIPTSPQTYTWTLA